MQLHIASVIARIKIPPEAIVPLLIGIAALAILIFAGSALAEWKYRNPGAARTFGMIVGTLCLATSVFFLSRCLLNQIDPNNDGTGQLQFLDPPIAAFMAALAAAFWRMGDQPRIGLVIGVGIGLLMIAKPFIWPVISTYTESYGNRGTVTRSRTFLDPEHLEFVGSGIVVLVTGLVAGLKAKPLPPQPPPAPWPPTHIAR